MVFCFQIAFGECELRLAKSVEDEVREIRLTIVFTTQTRDWIRESRAVRFPRTQTRM